MFRNNIEKLVCLLFSLSDQSFYLKKEKLQTNGANCNSKNNFVVKAVVLFSLATITFYLLTEHRAHLLAYSSYILFLVFVLLHVFICGRHGKHGGHEMNGDHRECCGGGHNHGKHNHEETEQKGNGQKGGGHENTHQHEHNDEGFT